MEGLLWQGFWLRFTKSEIYQIKAKYLVCQRKPVHVQGFLFFSVHLEMAIAALLFLTGRRKISLEGADYCVQ